MLITKHIETNTSSFKFFVAMAVFKVLHCAGMQLQNNMTVWSISIRLKLDKQN